MAEFGRGSGDDINEVYELLDQIVRDYGSVTQSAYWWLHIEGRDLRLIQVTMACEDLLGVDNQPRYIAEFLARLVADQYGA